jgi:hypothetical protein
MPNRNRVALLLTLALFAFGCGSSRSSAPTDGGAMGGARGASGKTSAGSGGSSGGIANAGGSTTSSGGTGSAGGSGGSNAGAANAGGATGSGGGMGTDGATTCVDAKLLWSEDFETGDYRRWTSNTYDKGWGNACQDNGFSTDHAVSATHSHRSEITCAYTAEGNVQRGYGGLQFDGDTLVPAYTNQGTGIDAPYGLVNTFHSWIDTPTIFQNGTWFSFWTVNGSCDWSEPVLTLGLEDPSNRLAAAHYQEVAAGTRVFLPGAPGFPLGRWVRITLYVNYYDGVMHVWQDGAQVSHVTFGRVTKTICQWHWGAYASGDNDNLVLYEDDNSIWKLQKPWTDFTVEPWFGGSVRPCNP